ncbi:hypothetical protein AAMO2058_001093400 [Amorphochlora amoebiformis]|mmetsp:Transcript_25001/g.39514  ORF Transcript_25001/g.39514 Transcript_25001/m.39514 type:complete len:439 (-) Transcript_25001:52-1368(-)|eukprot:956302-Amorphochlora_amoeboformis.AAC.1
MDPALPSSQFEWDASAIQQEQAPPQSVVNAQSDGEGDPSIPPVEQKQSPIPKPPPQRAPSPTYPQPHDVKHVVWPTDPDRFSASARWVAVVELKYMSVAHRISKASSAHLANYEFQQSVYNLLKRAGATDEIWKLIGMFSLQDLEHDILEATPAPLNPRAYQPQNANDLSGSLRYSDRLSRSSLKKSWETALDELKSQRFPSSVAMYQAYIATCKMYPREQARFTDKDRLTHLRHLTKRLHTWPSVQPKLETWEATVSRSTVHEMGPEGFWRLVLMFENQVAARVPFSAATSAQPTQPTLPTQPIPTQTVPVCLPHLLHLAQAHQPCDGSCGHRHLPYKDIKPRHPRTCAVCPNKVSRSYQKFCRTCFAKVKPYLGKLRGPRPVYQPSRSRSRDSTAPPVDHARVRVSNPPSAQTDQKILHKMMQTLEAIAAIYAKNP